jgi:hypothetical protein
MVQILLLHSTRTLARLFGATSLQWGGLAEGSFSVSTRQRSTGISGSLLVHLELGPPLHRTTNVKHQHHPPSFDKMGSQEEQSRKRKSGESQMRIFTNSSRHRRIGAVRPMTPARRTSKLSPRALDIVFLTSMKRHRYLVITLIIPRMKKMRLL